jgi:hypothetical protein
MGLAGSVLFTFICGRRVPPTQKRKYMDEMFRVTAYQDGIKLEKAFKQIDNLKWRIDNLKWRIRKLRGALEHYAHDKNIPDLAHTALAEDDEASK